MERAMSEGEIAGLLERHARGVSRREFFLRGLACGLSLGSLAVMLRTGEAASQLNVLGWGGSYQDSLARWVNAPFQSATGAKVLFQAQSYASQSLARITAETAKPTLDIWMTTAAFPLLLAKAGALQELAKDKVPNLADIVPVAVQTYQGKAYGAGIHVNVNLLIVDNQRIKTLIPNYTIDMLKSWTFLYRPELKNQIGISAFGGQSGSSLISIPKPYGGSEFDEEKFFAAMRKLAPNVHTIKTSAIGWVQQLLSKEIVAAQAGEEDATAVLKAGAPVDIAAPVDPLAVAFDYIVAIKNGPAGIDLALKYVNAMLQPVVMAPYCTQLGAYSPNSKAPVTPLGMPAIAADQMARAWHINYEAAIANYDVWNERFSKEIVPLLGR
jgi:spermidine/putrescine-binding protein